MTFTVDGNPLGSSVTNACGVATNTYYSAGGPRWAATPITCAFAGDAGVRRLLGHRAR